MKKTELLKELQKNIANEKSENILKVLNGVQKMLQGLKIPNNTNSLCKNFDLEDDGILDKKIAEIFVEANIIYWTNDDKPLIPNKKTIAAMKEARKGNLKTYDSFEDFEKSLF